MYRDTNSATYLFARQSRCSYVVTAMLLSVMSSVTWSQGLVEFTDAFPRLSYYSPFTAFYDGDFERALEGFQNAARDGFRSIDGAWVDNICARTMVGECHYRLGNLRLAMENYNAAVGLFASYNEWMTRVDFPNALRTDRRIIRPAVTWATGKRPVKFAEIPDSFPVLLGRLNNDAQIQRGGTVVLPEFRLLNVQEIVRCTTLALRRRYELLGTVSKHDPLTTRLVAASGPNIGKPNHWSQAWVNVQRGYALAAAGKLDAAAKAFTAGALLGGQFDHDLSAAALYGLGQMSLAEGKADAAKNFFIEASASAAAFGHPDLVEEAMDAANTIHLAGTPDVPLGQIAAAATWAKQSRFRHAQSALAAMGAETLAAMGQTNAAGRLLNDSRASLNRRDSLSAPMLAKFHFVASHVNYQKGRLPAAQASLARAINIQQTVSPWLYQIDTTLRLYESDSGALSARNAGQLYEGLLREPVSEDWLFRPLDTMGFILNANQAPYESWFHIAIERAETQKALEIGDRMKRRFFYSNLPLGGRLLAMRWLLEADESVLSDKSRERRADLLTRYPMFKDLSDKVVGLREKLSRLPLADLTEEQFEEQKKLAGELDNVSLEQEALLGAIALRREPCPFVFPPLRTTAEIQDSVGPGQVALVYVATSSNIHAFMLSSDKYASWVVESPSRLRKGLAKLFSAYGLTAENGRVTRDQLANDSRDEMGAKVLKSLIPANQHGFWNKFEELVIVPDNLLWYVPFEALPVPDSTTRDDKEDNVAGTDGPGNVPLINKMRIRYLPMASLLSFNGPATPRNPKTAAVLGKMFPRDKDELAVQQFETMQEVADEMHALPKRLGGDSGVLRSTWERLLVLDDIPDAREGPLSWSPGRIDDGKAGGSIARWMMLPWGGPSQLLLPGFHTATESGLKKSSSSGDELFLASTGLMATGAETILLSRWRTGGMSCYDLMREFLQEEPTSSPAEAWQRALQVVRDSQLDPAWEPRIAPSKDPEPLSADHPFFWAGYMLVDHAGNFDPEADAKKAAGEDAAGEDAAGAGNAAAAR